MYCITKNKNIGLDDRGFRRMKTKRNNNINYLLLTKIYDKKRIYSIILKKIMSMVTTTLGNSSLGIVLNATIFYFSLC